MAAPPSPSSRSPSSEVAVHRFSGTLDVSSSPSRTELLSMVKKHSHLIGWTIIGAEDDASDVGMDDKFWHEMLDLFFVRGRQSKRSEEDDLVFFVNNMKLHGYGFNDNMEDPPPFFVRRWAPTLEKISINTVEVDWERSFYLNLIAHTSYTVTVAIFGYVSATVRIEDLRNRAVKNKQLPPVYKVTKNVYASPSRVNFHLDRRKAVETLPAYPNIFFSVDDFDDTFDAVFLKLTLLSTVFFFKFKQVLSDPEHCYCVILNAHDGAAFPEESECKNPVSNTQPGMSCGSAQEKPPKVPLFVTVYFSFVIACRSKFGSFLSLGHDHNKLDRLFMKGPEGRGEVEVAVSGIADQSSGKSKKDPGDSFRVLVHRAASAASKLVKHAYESSSANRQMDDELVPLKCCLMSVSLPWDYIAHDLLHKDTPPMDL
ncbi:CW7 [Zea mays]|uniref:CW7 n=1 Tax=Zea mays TaxID=4577 RepID=A0A1D6KAV4_MAIZE|nr:CW7 [Zea mays]